MPSGHIWVERSRRELKIKVRELQSTAGSKIGVQQCAIDKCDDITQGYVQSLQ